MTIRTPDPLFDDDESVGLLEDSTFPRSIYYIVGNEFCERFSFYGMKAILPIYLTAKLGFGEDRATTLIHTFNFAAYFFTILGAWLADSGGAKGKYQTILWLSGVYAIGSSILAISSAIPSVATLGMTVGLTLLAMGTGGIKPCVSSFGGDQFEPSQREQIARFFSLFYFAINAGSVLSMLITPILRQDLHW